MVLALIAAFFNCSGPDAIGGLVLTFLNFALLGFAFWWDAVALLVVSLVNLMAMSIILLDAFLRRRLLRPAILGGFSLAAVIFLIPAITGTYAVSAYRCMRSNCGGFPPPPTCTECSGLDFQSFVFDPELPVWAQILQLQGPWKFFWRIVNLLPEGICWVNMAGGFFLMVYVVFDSVFYKALGG